MEEEVRIILRSVIKGETPHKNLVDLAQDLFGCDGVKLEPHPDFPVRAAPKLDA